MQPKAPAQTFPRKRGRMARNPEQTGPKAPPPKARRRAGCQRVRCAVTENYRRSVDAADSPACWRFFFPTQTAPQSLSLSLSEIHAGLRRIDLHVLKQKKPPRDTSTIKRIKTRV